MPIFGLFGSRPLDFLVKTRSRFRTAWVLCWHFGASGDAAVIRILRWRRYFEAAEFAEPNQVP